jgi:hypothetical protein
VFCALRTPVEKGCKRSSDVYSNTQRLGCSSCPQTTFASPSRLVEGTGLNLSPCLSVRMTKSVAIKDSEYLVTFKYASV